MNKPCPPVCPSKVPTTSKPIVVSNGQAIIGMTIEGEQLVSFTQPSHGTVTIDDGGTPDNGSDDILRYVPNAGYSGADTFTYTVINSSGEEVTRTVVLNVEGHKSDSGDTLDNFSIILMIILTGLVSLYYKREEEIVLEKKERK